MEDQDKIINKTKLKSYGDTLPLGCTYDAYGQVLTYKNSNGGWSEYTRDAQGRVLTYKDSDGNLREYTRDAHGKVLTYKDSDGNWRGFSNEDIDKERARLKQVRKNLKRSKK